MNIIKLHIALATVLLAGCTVGPNFTRPDAKLPNAWCDTGCQAKQTVPSVTAAAPINTAWWTSFNDPELAKLEARVADANLDLKVASLRLEESRAERSITAADQHPSINGNASAVRERASANGVTSLAGALTQSTNAATAANGTGPGIANLPSSKGSAPLNLFQAGFDASWEIDLWGRVRREVEAADASVDAQADARRDLLMSTMAEVARDYIQLRGTQTDYAITLDSLKAAKDAERVTRERKANGLASDLDVEEAASQVSAENALLPQLAQQEAETINRLSFLLGQAPGALRAELEETKPVPPTPPVVPVGLPSDLARRRPDIREAEANLHQATAQIGVAKADFYPSITLSASGSLQATQFSKLGDWGSRQFSIGPSINLPIFEGGRLKATLNLRKEQQQEAAINYQRTVLSAWHEIDNALTQYSSQQQRHDELTAEVQDNQRALRLAQAQYTAGTGSFLQVLDAERRLLSAQQDLTDNTTQISTTLVSLYKALGGGWEATYPEAASNDAVATTTQAQRF
ncbi:efflux transporter outer membrane subunit [Dyella sp. 2HG41-7]|uniref:efflux transporter outer membrane subunit n=1 Tax=Dyella sp. 2HG41-7 TaxID=2883239 RepID=UPI001F45F94A|nr:efflux transporter outer membrane subunit [Dyella sp. 2HG41-7]